MVPMLMQMRQAASTFLRRCPRHFIFAVSVGCFCAAPHAVGGQLASIWAAELANRGGTNQLKLRPVKPHQVVSTNTPPLSPAFFEPNASPLILPAYLPHPTNWTRPVAIDPNKPKPHQVTSTKAPPLSPVVFNPDANPLILPAYLPPKTNWTRTVAISTNAPPAQGFNPDPGASLPVPTNAAPSLFPNEPAPVTAFTPPAVPPPLALPREDVRLTEIVPPHSPPPGNYGSEPLTNGLALPRDNVRSNVRIDQKWEVPQYSTNLNVYPTNTVPNTNRWRIGFEPWRRYTRGVVEQPYETPNPLLWHPYKQSILKGDVPVIGQDIFLDLTGSTETETEIRRRPTASGVSGAVAGEYEFYGDSEEVAIQQYFGVTMNLFKGDTSFRPVDWSIKIEPVFNVNYLSTRETGVVSPDPRGSLSGNNNTPPPNNGFVLNPGDISTLLNGQVGPAGSLRASQSTTRTETFIALQQAYAEFHIADLSDNYDFLSARIGLQPFNSDFRGFIFNDDNLGARLFGNWDNNLYQYNLAFFDMREKDTDSELNTLADRGQQVLIANLYRQDFLWPGYTAEWSFHANLDEGGTHYDDNGNLVRPEPLGTIREHDVDAYYLGWAGDGHIGRFNVSHAFYEVLGHDSFNQLAGRPVDIDAQMAALEVSYDRDWARYKASIFYASGDHNPTGGTASGFDSIVDNPNFSGGPFSYWARQGFNLGGTFVDLKTPASLLPDLRTSKSEGQANFVNPGAIIPGIGAEFDVTPKLRTFLNANYIFFADTASLKTALMTAKVGNELGWDLSAGVQYRPLLTDNIIISAGLGVLIPGQGYKDIYQTSTEPPPGFSPAPPGAVDDFLYSGVIAVTFTF